MDSSGRRLIVVVALLALLVVSSELMAVGEAAISCSTVSGKLANCVGYLTGTQSGGPSGACCSGVQSLYSITRGAKADRVTACNCIKTLASALGSKLKGSSVSSLPGQCGVNLGYSISTSTNCAGIP